MTETLKPFKGYVDSVSARWDPLIQKFVYRFPDLANGRGWMPSSTHELATNAPPESLGYRNVWDDYDSPAVRAWCMNRLDEKVQEAREDIARTEKEILSMKALKKIYQGKVYT
tara:strand:- start:10810 stop:11148 length:339 start_codon:yes stop_codon:yes gene_type:complete